jgi:hypothetical protein
MMTLPRAFAIAFLAAIVPATIVLAQQAEETEPPAVEQNEDDDDRAPSPELMTRLEDGRIAMALAALKLTPEQQKLWAPVEEKIRADYAEHRKTREEWRAKREARRSEDRSELSLPDRIERRSARLAEEATWMNERAAKAKEFAAVLKPFYDSLTAEQKEVADHVLRRFAGGKGRHGGHGWRMGHHRGWGGHHHRWN